MRIAICDDDLHEREHFEKALCGWDANRNAEKFSDGASLLSAAKNMPPFDIVFLDIYMPGENGIDIAKELQRITPETGIVFVTTSREHAIDAFSLYALNYILKPVTTEGIADSFRRLNMLRSENRERITFSVGSERHTVFLDEISRLENENHAVNVILADGRSLKVWLSLSELEHRLDSNFLKINRGIVVNMEYIEQMRTDICVMRDGTKLPIAVRQSAAIRAAYDNYVFDRLSRRKGFSVGDGKQ